MELSAWLIYLVSVLAKLQGLAIVATVSSALFMVANSVDEYSDQKRKQCSVRRIKVGFVALLISIAVWLLTPGYKTAAAMYVLPAVANSEMAHNLPDAVNRFLEDYIRQFIDDESESL